MSPLNSINFIGSILSFHPTENSFHVFAAVARKWFDLEGLARYSNICKCGCIFCCQCSALFCGQQNIGG